MNQNKQINNTKRVAKNTLLLYVRMFLVLVVSLYTSRLILKQLGVVDFGIYSVVGGIVVLFNVLSASFSESTSRFYAFCIGKNDFKRLKRQYFSSQALHWILGVVICILSCLLGVILIDYKLNIPSERIFAAKAVLLFSSIAFGLRLTNVPYRAMIIAFERMNFFALFGVFEVLFKLENVFLLYFIEYDHLIVFALLTTLEPIVNNIVLRWYCRKHFEVCHGKIQMDRSSIVDMTKFAGWDMLGAVERILQDQGINIIINCFCFPIVNAGRAVAIQIKNAITQFTGNFQTAIAPQITKSYAENNIDQLNFFINKASKFSFFLLLILACPIFANTRYILSVWLGQVPPYAEVFVRYSVYFVLTDAFYEIMNLGAKATGNLKRYRISTSAVSLLNVPLAYFLMSYGMKPELTMLQISIINVLVLCVQLYILKDLINLNIRRFMTKVLLPCYLLGFFLLFVSWQIGCHVVVDSIGILLISSVIIILVCILFVVLLGLTKEERRFILGLIKNKLR